MSASGMSVLPPSVVVPMAVLTALVIVAHMIVLRCAPDMPLSRKRIRNASAVLMLITTVVLAHAFGFARFDDPRRFTLSWLAAVVLLVMVLVLAGLDALNNIRLARLQKRRIRNTAREIHHALVQVAANAKATPEQHDHETRAK